MNKNLSRKVVLRFAWQGFPYEIGRTVQTGPMYSDMLLLNEVSLVSSIDRDPSVKKAEGGGLLSTRSSGHTRKGEIRATKKADRGREIAESDSSFFPSIPRIWEFLRCHRILHKPHGNARGRRVEEKKRDRRDANYSS